MDGTTKKLTQRQAQKARARIAREMKRDLKTMESLEWQAQWLNARDSNDGLASCLTEAIEVLIGKAIELHKEELENWKI